MRSFIIASALSLISVVTAAASTPRELITRVGVVENGGKVEILTAPSATLLVRIDIETEQFEAGVYARYAQRHLGIHAPLVSKSSTQIIDAKIALAPSENYIADADFTANTAAEVVGSSVVELPIDLMSSNVLSDERAAASAAEELFWIRQLRSDILSGELGDGFYGGGLESALKNLEEQEAKLTELFMGRTTTIRESRIFPIIMETTTESYRVCRFSETAGIVDLSDVSADLIMLSVKALNGEPIDIKSAVADDKSTVLTYRVAAPSKCELYNKERALSQSIIPLFEYGYDLNYVVPSSKK